MTTAQKDSHEVEVSPTELEERLALLQGISIFFALPDRDVRRIARRIWRRHAAPGTEIVHKGEGADRLHVIASGKCAVRASCARHHTVSATLLSCAEVLR